MPDPTRKELEEMPGEQFKQLSQAAQDAATDFSSLVEAINEMSASMHAMDMNDDNPGWRLEGFRWRPDASEEEWIP